MRSGMSERAARALHEVVARGRFVAWMGTAGGPVGIGWDECGSGRRAAEQHRYCVAQSCAQLQPRAERTQEKTRLNSDLSSSERRLGVVNHEKLLV